MLVVFTNCQLYNFNKVFNFILLNLQYINLKVSILSVLSNVIVSVKRRNINDIICISLTPI